MLFSHMIVERATFLGQGNENNTTIFCVVAACYEVEAFQAIDDACNVAFIGDQETTQLHHRKSLSLVKMLESPELARTQSVFGEETAVAIIKEDEGFVEQPIGL